MKPFLGIDITVDKRNETVNGEEFVTANASQASMEALEKSLEEMFGVAEKAQLPMPLRIINWICAFVGMICVVAIFRGLVDEDGVTLEQAYQNVPYIFWIGGACLVIWGILTLISRSRSKQVLNSNESDNASMHYESVSSTIMAELKIPETAREVDLLSFSYKLKDGKVIPKVSTTYDNPIYHAFVSDGALQLANLGSRYSFPLSDITAIRTVKKNICISGWNKDTGYKKGRYAEYKMTEDNQGNIHFKKYHIIEISKDGEIWGIYIPCYELPVFEKLIGIKAEE